MKDTNKPIMEIRVDDNHPDKHSLGFLEFAKEILFKPLEFVNDPENGAEHICSQVSQKVKEKYAEIINDAGKKITALKHAVVLAREFDAPIVDIYEKIVSGEISAHSGEEQE